MKRVLILLFILLFASFVQADEFVPEFGNMQTIRCDFEETLYNQDNSVVSTSKKFRVYKLDDENKKIYLQKEPIDYISYYDFDRVEFSTQVMTDDSIGRSDVIINRNTLEYNAKSYITYDFFGTRYSVSSGMCKLIP